MSDKGKIEKIAIIFLLDLIFGYVWVNTLGFGVLCVNKFGVRKVILNEW